MRSGESEAIYSARGERAYWIIRDAGALSAFLSAEDTGLATIRLYRYDSRDDWAKAIKTERVREVRSHAKETLFAVGEPLAHECARLAADRGLSYINERDHFQRCVERVLPAATSPRAKGRMRMGRSLAAKCPEWPKLGAVDVYLEEEGYPPAGIELKADSGIDALHACAWDAVKLAFLIARGDLSSGFLIAAAPAGIWRRKCLGHDLFEFKDWRAEALRTHFTKPFIKYELDGKKKGGGYPVARTVPAELARSDSIASPSQSQ